MQKRCPKCGETKPLEGGFYVLASGRVSGYCRACVAADKRRRYAERPEVRERVIEQAIAYQQAHRERLAEAKRAWEEANKERRQQRRREHRNKQ